MVSLIGFAIPAETVSAVIRQLEAHGRVELGYLGIFAQERTPEAATALPNTSHSKAPNHLIRSSNRQRTWNSRYSEVFDF
jgi:S1-C subfamily serine protease